MNYITLIRLNYAWKTCAGSLELSPVIIILILNVLLNYITNFRII